MRRPVADDVIAVLELIRQGFRPSDPELDLVGLRKRAVLAVAQAEFSTKRFSTELSAENSIRDGCVRRLGYADATEFDNHVQEWLRGRPHELSVRVSAKATTQDQRQRLAEILAMSPPQAFADSQRTIELEQRLAELQSTNLPRTPDVLRMIQRVLKVYERPSAITRFIKQTRGATCQLCGELGFVKKNGIRYCEVHHLFHLSKNPPPGCLGPEYLVVLCATCHRRMHYADVGKPVREGGGWRVRVDDTEHGFIVETVAPPRGKLKRGNGISSES